LKEQLENSATSPRHRDFLFTLRGEVYYYSGDETAADLNWDRVNLSHTPELKKLLAVLNRLQLPQRQLRYIDLDRRARRDSLLWVQEAARAHLTRGEYEAAFRELRKAFARQETPDGRLERLLLEIPFPDDSSSLGREVSFWRGKNQGNKAVLHALTSWLIRYRRFTEAAPLFLKLDSLGGDAGRELYRYGSLLIKEEAWKEAIPVLRRFLEGHGNDRRAFSAGLLLATAREKLNQVPEAIALLQTLLKKKPDKNLRSEIRTRLGDLYFYSRHDPRAALEWYEQVEGPGELLVNARLAAVQCRLALNEVSRARTELHDLQQRFDYDDKLVHRINWERVKLHFRLAETDSAALLLDTLLTTGFTSSEYNDMLELRLLLRKAGEDSVLVPVLGEAELQELRGEWDRARALYRQVLTTGTSSRTAWWALKHLLQIPPEAGDQSANTPLLGLVDSLLNRFSRAPEGDEFLLARCRLLEARDDSSEAAQTAYENFLAVYPDSPHADRVRLHIRDLEKKPGSEGSRHDIR